MLIPLAHMCTSCMLAAIYHVLHQSCHWKIKALMKDFGVTNRLLAKPLSQALGQAMEMQDDSTVWGHDILLPVLCGYCNEWSALTVDLPSGMMV